ncbi:MULTISPECIES: division/cell wall cluster transcriptional repressor MraZ [Roseateles]|uniref:Transcriptional regulator MraZ n=1 Tax=Roseateles flavus TaxID=3149041 RepID=A0ABV0GE02_9BURK|nr:MULTISPECIES: division/cell wall cluster transcriptional repressor MraZ [unclassified Roseateles]MBB2486110.1 division/cell wall cluster transcriptional repressor MraZ [Mitsuaria sp. WAJ17]
MFQGASALAMDAKGRLTVPTRHRELLQGLCNGQLTITKHPEGCLMVFPRPAWETFRDRIAALPMSAAGWKRVFLGNAQDVEIDSAARVLIAPELRASASLQKDVMLLGMGSHFELWDAAAYAAHEAQVMQSELPDALKDFSF